MTPQEEYKLEMIKRIHHAKSNMNEHEGDMEILRTINELIRDTKIACKNSLSKIDPCKPILVEIIEGINKTQVFKK